MAYDLFGHGAPSGGDAPSSNYCCSNDIRYLSTRVFTLNPKSFTQVYLISPRSAIRPFHAGLSRASLFTTVSQQGVYHIIPNPTQISTRLCTEL